MTSVVNPISTAGLMNGGKQTPPSQHQYMQLAERPRGAFEVGQTPKDAATEVIDEGNAAIRAAAEDFEAAFLTQMLTFSGLGKALTTGGGEAVSAFTGFYIESFAEQMTQAGGLGLADHFYADLVAKNNLGQKEEAHDDHGKL